jgi:dephospho-CoA kinase
MFTLALTGGIGTGKSTATNLLMAHYGPAGIAFDSDASVHRWLTNPEIVESIADRFGRTVLDEQGAVDRSALGKRVFASSKDRGYLESLLHPRVQEEGIECRRKAVARDRDTDEPVDLFVFDVPLLYEVDFDAPHDLDVLIAASPEIQRQRLRDYRGLSDERIDAVIEAQMPILEKVQRCRCAIWNDGGIEELNEQLNLLIQTIEERARKAP